MMLLLKQLLILITYTFICSLSQISAQTTSGPVEIVDFQSLEQAGPYIRNLSTSYEEKGFCITEMTGKTFASYQTGTAYYAGSTMLISPSVNISLARKDLGGFDFIGIDLAPADLVQNFPIQFSGYRGRNLVFSETYHFVGSAGVQHFTPKLAFANISELRWATGFQTHQVDNIQLRKIGGVGPLPLLTIRNGVSTWLFDYAYMRAGTTYMLQKSIDLKTWTDVYSFPAYSPTTSTGGNGNGTMQVMGEAKGYFRLKSVP